MFRTDKMSYCEMFIQPEAAFETMTHLGQMGCVQFIDMNEEVAPYLKNYITEVCRCADMERKLKFIDGEMMKENIVPEEPMKEPLPIHPTEMVMYENLIDKWENDIYELSENQSSLMQDLLEMKEMRYVLNTIGPMLGSTDLGMETTFARGVKTGAGDLVGSATRLFVMAGVVRRTRSFPFELMLWRISHGNIYYRQAEYDEVLKDPYTGGDVRKVAFLAICQGETLYARMEKVFTGFRINLYPCPETYDERMFMLQKIEVRVLDLEEILTKTNYHRCKSLRAVSRQWRVWMIQVRKTKAIYHQMNRFTLDITKKCLIGQCWVPDRDLKRVQDTLESCSQMLETNVQSFMVKVPTDTEPPTYHRTNKFTRGFQALINAYGDSKYREVNPGLYTIVTFPFLFGIMFGDSGHAVIIIVFALWMIIMEKTYMIQKGSEIWNIMFGGRYVILLLGLFSLYAGLIYNEMFSKSINLSNSMWKNTILITEIQKSDVVELSGKSRLNKPYVWGMDPVWAMTKNKIMIENSIKMKLSIIIGVVHMLFGICLSVINHLIFRKYYAIFLQFLPQFLFLTCIFMFLVFMVYFKWFTYFDEHPNPKLGSACAPQLLILFIDMVLLSSTSADAPQGCDLYLFEGQQLVHSILIFIALACIPVLLFGTPVYVYFHNKKQLQKAMNALTRFRKYQMRDSKDTRTDERLRANIEKYNAKFPDLMILQAVHTIEFVLSTISHTASYLRLWALSLAHSQLSEMLWVMILSKMGLRDHSTGGILKIFMAFAVWATFTVAILVMMEGLSSFLHTLRLHWVEFMSKFFIGGGYPFQPYSFKAILAVEADKPEGACKITTKQRAEPQNRE